MLVTVKGEHGIAQADTQGEFYFTWKGHLVFGHTEDLDGIITLLQALQQDLNSVRISRGLKVAEGRKIRHSST